MRSDDKITIERNGKSWTFTYEELEKIAEMPLGVYALARKFGTTLLPPLPQLRSEIQ